MPPWRRPPDRLLCWSELRVESRTKYSYDTLECLSAKRSSMLALRPDDIDLRDTAAFVWEIK